MGRWARAGDAADTMDGTGSDPHLPHMTEGYMHRSFRIAASVFFMAAAIVYLGAEAVTAAAWTTPAYSYGGNWISDLGTSSSPLHLVMNAAFILRGVLFLIAAILATLSRRRSRRRPFVLAAIVHAIGGILLGLVSEDIAPPLGNLHYIGAVLAIAGGNVAVIAGGRAIRSAPPWFPFVSVALGLVGLTSLLALGFVEGDTPAGGLERISVYTINAWELLTASVLLGMRDHRERLGPPQHGA